MSGGAWFDYFLTAPFGRFTIEYPNDVEVAVLLVLVGLAVTELTLWAGVRPTLEQRQVAALLAYQVGAAYAADANR